MFICICVGRHVYTYGYRAFAIVKPNKVGNSSRFQFLPYFVNPSYRKSLYSSPLYPLFFDTFACSLDRRLKFDLVYQVTSIFSFLFFVSIAFFVFLVSLQEVSTRSFYER